VPLIVVIEPDQRQAAIVRRLVRDYVSAEVVWADTKDRALSALSTRVPDLILVSALLPPRDEHELTDHLRGLRGAMHLQTLTIPQLAGPESRARGRTLLGSIGKRRGQSAGTGCDPRVFAEEIRIYLVRAGELRAETEAIAAAMGQLAAASASRAADVQAPESPRGEPAVAIEAPAIGEGIPAVEAPAIIDTAPVEAAGGEVGPLDRLPGDAIGEAIADSPPDEPTATVQATIADVPDEQAAGMIDNVPAFEAADRATASAAPAEPPETTDVAHEQIAALIASAAAEVADAQPIPAIEDATPEEMPVAAAAPAIDHGIENDGAAERAGLPVIEEVPSVSDSRVVAADEPRLVSDDLTVAANETPPVPEELVAAAEEPRLVLDDLTVAADEARPVPEELVVAAEEPRLVSEDLTVAAEDAPPVVDTLVVAADEPLLVANDLTVAAEAAPPASDVLMAITPALSSIEEETQAVPASVVGFGLPAAVYETWRNAAVEAARARERAPVEQVARPQASPRLSIDELLALERELEPDAPFESALQMVPLQAAVEDAVLSLGEEEPAIEVVEPQPPSEALPAVAVEAAADDWLSKTVWSLTLDRQPSSRTRSDRLRDQGKGKTPRSTGLVGDDPFADGIVLPATRHVPPHRRKTREAMRPEQPLSIARLAPLALWARVESERPESEAVRAADRNVFLSLINRLKIPPEVARVSYASGARIARVRVAASDGEPEETPPVIILSKRSLKRPKRSPRKLPLRGTGLAVGPVDTPTRLI
jgi:CheY-like chemotaxis protein